MPRAEPNRKRCAIYTRKSSEEGLEQEFYSLAAQREACEAYICSHVNARYRCQFFSNLEVSVVRGFGRASGGRGAPGVAQRPTGARCTALETATVL